MFLDTNKTNNIEVESGQTYQLIIFRLGEQEYGLMIDQIREVVITPNITKVPLTANYIRGVANIRGNVMAIVDLEQRFQLTQEDSKLDTTQKTFTLVIAHEEYKMGILLREVPSTLSLSDKNIDFKPSLIQSYNADRDCIIGIAQLGDRIIILLDILKAVAKKDFADF